MVSEGRRVIGDRTKLRHAVSDRSGRPLRSPDRSGSAEGNCDDVGSSSSGPHGVVPTSAEDEGRPHALLGMGGHRADDVAGAGRGRMEKAVAGYPSRPAVGQDATGQLGDDVGSSDLARRLGKHGGMARATRLGSAVGSSAWMA